jgi:hypothetical protein
MSKHISIDDIQDCIVHTEKVAHVAFYIVRDKEYEPLDLYLVYSESDDRPLSLVSDPTDYEMVDQRLHYGGVPYEEALTILREAIEALERRLEAKRKGIPTARQLHFLFREKIPIPLELTWGEASDLIEERLHQKEKEKQAHLQAKTEKFNGLIVGMEVVLCKDTYPGRGSIGEITKLTSNNDGDRYAWVRWEGEFEYRMSIDALRKATDEQVAQLALRIEANRKLREELQQGTRVLHSLFGEGVITSKADNRNLVYIEFDSGAHSGWFTPTASNLQKITGEEPS